MNPPHAYIKAIQSRYRNMSYSSLVYACLGLRSADTMETLSQLQQRYLLLSSEGGDLKTVIHPCANLQKKPMGLSGLMTEIPGDCLLNNLDMLTEEVFRGISVVKCNISETEAIALGKNKTKLNADLYSYFVDKHTHTQNKGTMLLDQIMPSGESQDFWWLKQTCEFKGGLVMKESILHDNKSNDFNFYDAFTCIYMTDENNNSYSGIDESYKDACVWDPVLHGSIGLYTQRSGDSSSVFFVCVSDFTHIASDIVRSIKSDLGNSTNVYDFCSSKEMWFLENISLRNRLRLISQAAAHLDICVPRKSDMFAHDKQTTSDLAVECCGTSLDHIECRLQQNPQTFKTVSSVRLYKDCADVTEHKGPLPVFLGPSLGFLLLLPDKLSKYSFATYNDTMPFVHNKAAGNTHLCPTLNISENSNTNIHKIATEQQNIMHVSANDLIFDMNQQGVLVPAHVLDLVTSMDEYGNFIFYGVKYSVSTPYMIYPRVLPAFTQCIPHSQAKTPPSLDPNPHAVASVFGSSSQMQASNTTTPPTPLGVHSTLSPGHFREVSFGGGNLLDALPLPRTGPPSTPVATGPRDADMLQEPHNLCESVCQDFVHHDQVPEDNIFDFCTQRTDRDGQPSELYLEWSDYVVDLLQKMTRMRHIDTVFLDPHVFFDNYHVL